MVSDARDFEGFCDLVLSLRDGSRCLDARIALLSLLDFLGPVAY